MRLDGETLTLEADGSFTHRVRLKEGSNRFVFEAEDALGNRLTRELTLTLDTVAPKLELRSPAGADGVWPQSVVTVTGESEPGVRLTVSGDAVPVEADGGFSYTAVLANGRHELMFRAEDAAGNAATKTLRITVEDTRSPTLTVSGLSGGDVVKEAEQTLMGSLDEPGTVEVNGRPVTLDADYGFTHTLTLREGANTITVSAKDRAGNVRTRRLTVTLDTMPPSAPALTSHAAAPTVHYSRTSQIELRGSREAGTVIEASGPQGVRRVPAGGTEWALSLPLEEESRSVYSLTAVDAAGNVSAAVEVRWTHDSVAPQAGSWSPAGVTRRAPAAISVPVSDTGSGVREDRIRLQVVRAGEAVAGRVRWRAGRVTFTPKAAWADGEYAVQLRMEDRAGNTLAAPEHRFVLDRVAPAAPTLDALPERTGLGSVELRGGKEAGSSIWLDGEEAVPADNSERWSHRMRLDAGSNSFSLRAVDAAGNRSAATEGRIHFDDSPPGAVTLKVRTEGDGTELTLEWADYDEEANGADIKGYHVWQGTAAFRATSSARRVVSVGQGTKTYRVTGLPRGTQRHFAVLAEDLQGNLSGFTSVPATPRDTQAPSEVTGLRAASFRDRLRLEWTAPADDDLAGYAAYLDGERQPGQLSATAVRHELQDLEQATGYDVRLAAVDGTGNESAGVTLRAATLLANPAVSEVVALDGKALVRWAGSEPASLVREYRVYLRGRDFGTSVAGLDAARRVSGGTREATLGGLENGTRYWVAVTAVNLSGGEWQVVRAHAVTPREDAEGPALDGLRYAGSVLTDGKTLTVSGALQVQAKDRSGINEVKLSWDGEPAGNLRLERTEPDGAVLYRLDWSLRDVTDGEHVLAVRAVDAKGNASVLRRDVTVALAPPLPPRWTRPSADLTTSAASLVLEGFGAPGVEVRLRHNGSDADFVAARNDGSFRFPVTLAEGENTFRVRARHPGRRNAGGWSVTRTVTLDSSLPAAPTKPQAQGRAGGEISLSWQRAEELRVRGHHVYRSKRPFTSSGGAGVERLTSSPVAEPRFSDVPEADGTYHYRISSVNDLGTESVLSAQVKGVSDRVGPRVTGVAYAPEGRRDMESGRVAPGLVDVEVRFDEPLSFPPYYALAPEGGVPLSLSLRADRGNNMVYRGRFLLEPGSPSGLWHAVMSANDMRGNRGTEIDGKAGAALSVDTKGPSVAGLALRPAHPLRVRPSQLPSRTVRVSVTLDDEPTGTPRLVPELDGVAVAGYGNGLSLRQEGSDPMRWTGSFVLPKTAGAEQVSILSFRHRAEDDLGNVSEKVAEPNRFQVYQGDLPPAGMPLGLAAVAEAGGDVRLSWHPAEEAAGYALYRQAAGGTDWLRLAVPGDGTAVSYRDAGLADGRYRYAIASLRRANGQESESGRSAAVDVTADGTAPQAPRRLSLEVTGAGVALRWQAPQGESRPQDLRYRVYRLRSGTKTADTQGLTPLQDGIPHLERPIALDGSPDRRMRAYAVTAVDAAGNESPPSGVESWDVDVLPVQSYVVRRQLDKAPQLGWEHSDRAVVGYEVYREAGGVRAALHGESLHARAQLRDTGWQASGSASLLRYVVVAVDDEGNRSAENALDVPDLRVSLHEADSQELSRGVMNKLLFRVDNRGGNAWSGLRLYVNVGDGDISRRHMSEKFEVGAGGFVLAPVVVGGYQGLDDSGTLALEWHMEPPAGGRVEWRDTARVAVGDSALSLRLLPESLVRGGEAKVRLVADNTGGAETELWLARSNGREDSPELRLVLEDRRGNVLSRQAVRQFGGTAVTTLGGNSVARIPPGGRFTSEPWPVPVPSGAPDEVTLRLEADGYHHAMDREGHIRIAGGEARQAARLVDTPYYAELSEVEPKEVMSGGTVTLRGRSVRRADGQAVGDVPVRLVFQVDGFDVATAEVTSDAQGRFVHRHTVGELDDGRYQVSALHPLGRERPLHGRFVARRASVEQTEYRLSLSENDSYAFGIPVRAGRATSLRGVRVAYLAEDQADGKLPKGIQITVGEPVDVAAGAQAQAQLVFQGGKSAQAQGIVHLRVVSDTEGFATVGRVRLSYELHPARPGLLVESPGRIDTGLARGGVVRERVVVRNTGFSPLTGLRVSLAKVNGEAAPEWLAVSSGGERESLAVGETHVVQVMARPGQDVAEGRYSLWMTLSSEELKDVRVPVSVAVTQSGKGSVFFHASDIYTSTLDGNNRRIPGLAGARISLQNERVLTEQHEGLTDANGEWLLRDIPAGSYRWRAEADGHNAKAGRLTVRPGVTTRESAFLVNQVVTAEFSVREITIEDRYEIVLTAEYQTAVPVAVVSLRPEVINLPMMRKGEVFTGELEMRNHGLIRADSVHQTVAPANNDKVRFEFLREPPEALEAGEVAVLPYRVTAVSDFIPSDAGGTGLSNAPSGASEEERICSVVIREQACYRNECTCANGERVEDEKCTIWEFNWNREGCGGVLPIPSAVSVRRVLGGGAGGGGGGLIGGARPLGKGSSCSAEGNECSVTSEPAK